MIFRVGCSELYGKHYSVLWELFTHSHTNIHMHTHKHAHTHTQIYTYNYYDIIKEPMDLATISKRLEEADYKTPWEVGPASV